MLLEDNYYFLVGRMEVPGHCRRPGGQEEGEGRGVPQGTRRGRQGQAGHPQGSQDRRQDRSPPEGHRILWKRMNVHCNFSILLNVLICAP